MNTIVEVEQNVHFERLLTSDKEMQRKAQKAVRLAIRKARAELSKDARRALEMSSDPRAAYKAIKAAVYRRMLGGSVSILSPHRASGKAYSTPPTNRKRSKRTEQLLSYYGSDRGFILRFLNNGTNDRVVRGINDENSNSWDYDRRNGNRRYKGGLGNRGRIRGRDWFGHASQAAMEKAAAAVESYIEQAIAEAEA